jgi:hypothetical protein
MSLMDRVADPYTDPKLPNEPKDVKTPQRFRLMLLLLTRREMAKKQKAKVKV